MKYMQTVLSILAIAAAVYLAVTAALYFFQRSLIYFPDATYHSPSDAGLSGVEEVKLTTADGEQLIAWRALPAPGQPTLLYFHGNAGGLISRAERIVRFNKIGLGVFMPAYRGYSGSTGQPSEKALISDAITAYDYLRQQGVSPSDIIPYGESLGTGVAVQLASQKTVGALILDAPYTSLPAIGKRAYPFIPVETFMTDRFDSKRHIAKVDAPILIMHGTADNTIPIELGRALFEAAPGPKTFAAIEGAGHSDIYMFGALESLKGFLEAQGRNISEDNPVSVK